MNTNESKTPDPATNPTPRFAEGQKLAGCYGLKRAIPTADETVVWLAHDEVLGKDVSLHFVPPILLGDAAAMNGLRQEVKRNRQLIHPHILRVYDLVEDAGWAAVSMDAFEGESLAGRLGKKNGAGLDPIELQPWLTPLFPTLDDAHKINFLHRDLAPGNLFLTSEGKLLVTNFGISRSLAYALAREFLSTHTTGLPCARIGSRRIVIARKSLDRYAAANDTTATRDHNNPKEAA